MGSSEVRLEALPTTTPAPASAMSMPTAHPTDADLGGAGGGAESIPLTPVPTSVALMITTTSLPTMSSVDAGAGGPPAPVQVSPLNAGEINDNAEWDEYLTYRDNYLAQYSYTVRDVNVEARQLITVTDSDDLPLLGARVLVYDGQTFISESRTYANGQTLFFPSAWTHNAQTYRVVVQHGSTAVEFTLNPQVSSEWQVTLDIAQQSVPQLDVLFLVDATGSMADEIAQLQSNILSISSQMQQTFGNVDVRYGLVTYRDRGDAYVTQRYDFVSDVQEFQATLSRVRADGGGDTPESLNEALRVAVRDVSWRGGEAIKLIFLVADAAPHLDYVNDADYSHEMIAAAWRGIKVFPIASSGLTPDGEFIFRQIAQYTMGHFLFLTYQQGATAGETGTTRSDLEAGEQSYTVEQLDELVLRLITDEISALDLAFVNAGTPATVTSASLPPEYVVPNAFALVGSAQPVALRAAVVVSAPVVDDLRFTLSLPQMAAIVAGCLLVGYLISMLYRAERRKRKNEEILNAALVEDEG
jgi:uncharacterized protein YegL